MRPAGGPEDADQDIWRCLAVGVWCLFILLVSVAFVVDRGLADVGIVWVAVFGIGVVAPVLLLGQINRAIAGARSVSPFRPLAAGRKRRSSSVPWRRAAGSPLRRPRCGPRSPWMRRRRCSRVWPVKVTWRGKRTKALWPTPSANAAGKRCRAAIRVSRVSSRAANGASLGLEDPLSERELEVLNLLASGKTNSEAARDLFVSVGTVKSHTGQHLPQARRKEPGRRPRQGALARADSVTFSSSL